MEDEENIDMNLTPDILQQNEEGIVPDITTYNEDFKIGDLFILITKEGDDFIVDALVIIQEILKEERKILLKDENENDSFLYFDENQKIILKTDDYEIIDIEKVEEVDIDSIDDIDLIMTKDIYPEIDLQIVEVKEKKYSLQERKEHLITELISLYNAYNNESLIYQLSEISDDFVKMVTTKEDFNDYSNTLQFIKDIIHKKQFKFPPWIIPIVDNKKKVFSDTDESNDSDESPNIEEHDDIIIKKFYEELKEKIEAFSVFDDFNPNTYQSILALNDTYKPYSNLNLLTIPYTGMYFRNCNQSSPCNGLINQFFVDINNTKHPLKIPFLKDKKTVFESIIPQEQISIIGFYILPHKYLNFTLQKESHLSLHELYFLSNFKYSYIPFNKRFLKSEIVPHIMSKDSEKVGKWNNLIHSYLFNENPSINDLGFILKNNFPDYQDIIDSFPKNVKESIMNYNDLKKILTSYNISYHEMDPLTREKVNSMIKSNINLMIRNYNRTVKRKKIVLKEKKQIVLSTDDKIKLSKQYIFSLHVHSIRNSYIKRFIQTFSRKPELNENPNYLYEKASDNQLLCNHYLYTLNNDKDSFNTMRSVFGREPKDGIITCKICGEYLCPEDFSDLEGFSGGVPQSSREVIEEGETINQLTEKQISIKKHIQKISNVFGISLTTYDIQKIIENHELIDDTSLINHR